MRMDNTVGVAIPTLNAETYLQNLLGRLLSSKVVSRVLIIDSSSSDRTVEIANDCGVEVLSISKSDFNHGSTRELARKNLGTDIVVFLTQDAIPVNSQTISKLVKPIVTGKASTSYAKQIPKKNAGIFESFPKELSYGTTPQIRSKNDIGKYGVYSFFCSNSCAAWSYKALDEIGGFKPTLTNEDYFACAELLMNGHNVAYVPEAAVIHSHNYSLIYEFQRMFDTGYVRAERPWIQNMVGNLESKGKIIFNSLINKLLKENIFLIPYALLQTIFKYVGYKIGFNAQRFPKWLKKTLSGQKYFWDSKYYLD